MSNIGVRGYYLVTTTIKDNLLNDENVNTVTTGDITKIDLAKQTIFPLSHIIVNNVSQEEQVLRFNVSVICMDIVNQIKEETNGRVKVHKVQCWEHGENMAEYRA